MKIGHALQALSATLVCASMILGLVVLTPSTAEAAPIDGWIDGTVTDGSNPIENAYVLSMAMMGGGEIMSSDLTDASGSYNLTVIGGFQYLVMAFHGGYWATNASTTVNSGETVVVDFTMVSVAPEVEDVTLKGFVLDELGNPVTVGNILGYITDPANMGEGPPKYGNLTTADAFGFFTVNVLPSAIGGGVAVADVPGYPMADNTTTNPFVSGNTYWFNVTLQPQSYTDDAVIYGYVTDYSTGLPLEYVLVNYQSWNESEGRGYSNMTFTDATGYYEMNVTNGSAEVWFNKAGYSMFLYEHLMISEGSSTQFDAALLPTTATVRGNVTNLGTGSPLPNARVFLTDGMGNISMAVTNATGQYELDAFAGSGLGLGAEADGFGMNMTIVDILPGDNLWYDFGLRSMDAWLAGKVTDTFTGLPVAGAGIWVHNNNYSDWTSTNATGDYNFTRFLSGHYTMDVDAMDYRHASFEIDVAPGGNVIDVSIAPWNLPRTCRLWGYVNDSASMTGIQNADVEVGLGPPDYMEYNRTSTNMAGYYEMWVPPVDMMYVVSAMNHVHDEGRFNATGMTEFRLDIILVSDPWSPNITYDQSPLVNVSQVNPAIYDVEIEEIDPEQFALSQFIYSRSLGGFDYYYLIAMYAATFNPLSQSASNLPYTQTGDNYTIMYSWDTTIMGGWLWNSTDQVYMGAWQMWQGPLMYYALRGYYTNSTLMGWEQGTVFFDGTTEDFLFFVFDNGMLQMALPSDPTGRFSVGVSEVRVDQGGGGWSWTGGVMMGDWSVSGLKFTYDPLVPSGMYATVFSAFDFGDHGWGFLTEFTVDNEGPTADAGSDHSAIENTAATLDGSGSSDNVGIVNYTWNFTDNSVPVEVYGETATYNFTEVGIHVVTLTVRDGAGHTDTDDVLVDVTADQPPVADAGPDQMVSGGAVMQFDGSASTDDVGIVNWTWSFLHDGSPVELYGPNPAFIFLFEGVYDVTLTVRDSAGQTATDHVQITVSGMIPEFPMLLLPVMGVAALVLLARNKKKR